MESGQQQCLQVLTKHQSKFGRPMEDYFHEPPHGVCKLPKLCKVGVKAHDLVSRRVFHKHQTHERCITTHG